MKVNFNLSVSISGVVVNNNDKRYYNGVVDKEHAEEDRLDTLNIELSGSSEMEASETKEFILGIVDAVKTAAEVKMNEAKKSDTNSKTNVENLPEKEINNIDYVDDANKEDINNG